MDTPRSVTVVPKQVIKDTAAVSLQDALRTVPGITFGAGEGGNPTGDRPFIRGFDAQSDTYVDGVRDTGAQTREIFNLEQIEVSKGPNSAFGGRGSAGGSLNLVSKQAKAGNFIDGGFTYGSDQTRRYTLDLNQEFLDGNAAFRLNLLKHDANVAGRDEVDVSRWGVAPSLTFGLGSPTRVTVSHYHLESDDTPDSGIPYAKSSDRSKHNPDKPVNVDRGNFYGLTGRDFQKSRIDTSTITVEHDLTDSLTIRNTSRYGNSHQDYLWTQPDDSQGNINNGSVWRRQNNRVSTTTTAVNQTDLFGEFYLGGFKNSFSTGLEFSREDSKRDGYTVDTNTGLGSNKCNPSLIGAPSGYNCTSLENPNPHDPWNGSITRKYAPLNTVGTTKAIYAFDTIDLNEQWQVNIGARFDSFETTAKNHGVRPATKLSDKSSFWNWQAGLVWKPVPNGSIYASYATSATPPGSMLDNGDTSNAVDGFAISNNLEPEETTNYELGTKWAFFNERLELSAAIFRTDKDNTRILVANQTYDNAGQSRVDGVELSASGKLNEHWDLFATYTYLDSETLKSSNPQREGQALGNTPAALVEPLEHLRTARGRDPGLWRTLRQPAQRHLGGQRQAGCLLGAQHDARLPGDARPETATQPRQPVRQGLRRAGAPGVRQPVALLGHRVWRRSHGDSFGDLRVLTAGRPWKPALTAWARFFPAISSELSLRRYQLLCKSFFREPLRWHARTQ